MYELLDKLVLCTILLKPPCWFLRERSTLPIFCCDLWKFTLVEYLNNSSHAPILSIEYLIFKLKHMGGDGWEVRAYTWDKGSVAFEVQVFAGPILLLWLNYFWSNIYIGKHRAGTIAWSSGGWHGDSTSRSLIELLQVQFCIFIIHVPILVFYFLFFIFLLVVRY